MMASPVRRRTRARELALQFLYAFEMRGHEAMQDIEAAIQANIEFGEDTGEELPARDRDEILQYARDIAQGVHDRQIELNRWIEFIARNWRLERMAYLDRNILRVALYELLHQNEVPFKVVINEAIDIAKRYSTAQSGSFVNGILDRARILIQNARERDPHSVPKPPEPGLEGTGAAPQLGNTATVDAPFTSLSSDPAPTPRPATLRDTPAPAATTASKEDDEATPQPGEFPTAPDLSQPDALPRPRRRRTQRRRRPPESDSSMGSFEDED